MAGEKQGGFLNVMNATGAILGALVGGLGVFFSLGDTSPKSLAGMASSLERIAENLDKMGELDPAAAEEAAALLTSAGEISRKVVDKAPAGLELPNVDGILLSDEGVDIPYGETKTVLLGNGDRISTSYVSRSGRRYGLSVNGVEDSYTVGTRIYASEDGSCFIEFLRATSNYASVVVRPACPG